MAASARRYLRSTVLLATLVGAGNTVLFLAVTVLGTMLLTALEVTARRHYPEPGLLVVVFTTSALLFWLGLRLTDGPR